MNNNYILVKVEGKNVNNYLRWLIKNKINIIKLNIVSYNKLLIIIDNKDYELLTKYSKTYTVTILKRYGRLKIIYSIKNNIVIIIALITSIFFIYYLSNYIFSVDIIYNNKEIVDLITKELAKYDIKKYSHKKDYHYLTEVKAKILNDNKDTLEWIEIEESGTKYIVRLVERKKEKETQQFLYQSVVAVKDATITSVKAYSGEKIKKVGEFVKKGDVIISGILTKPDGTVIYNKASGVIIGEVWYKVDIEYPLYYQEEKVTGKSKSVLTIYFLNKEIPLFPYKKYKQFRRQSNILLENNLIPLKIAREKLYEVNIKEEIYTFEEAANKAIEHAKKKMLEKNSKIVGIKDAKILTKENQNSKIKLTLFISAEEDITDILEITEENTVPED